MIDGPSSSGRVPTASASGATRPARKGRLRRCLLAIPALIVGSSLAVLTPAAPVAAAEVPISQCNGVSNGGGQNLQCSIVVVNTVTDDPDTTGSIVTVNGTAAPFSPDIVTSVNQCNGSANGGGGTLRCTVSITTTITRAGAASAGAASVYQCNSNDPDALGTAPNLCFPAPATTSGASINQCNETGNGGGLVNPSSCTASGSISSSLPITITQCNGSANGGGSQVVCTALIETIVAPATTTTTAAVTTTTTLPPGGGTTTTVPAGGGTTTTTGPAGGTTTTVPAGGGTTTTVPAGGGTTTTAPGGAGPSSTAPGGGGAVTTTTIVGGGLPTTTSTPAAPTTTVRRNGPGLPNTGPNDWMMPFLGLAVLLAAVGALLVAFDRRSTRS